jgi:RNase H-fold protein (predicted Holliday junction resolvase)
VVGRTLALDIGEKRIGVAVGDEVTAWIISVDRKRERIGLSWSSRRQYPGLKSRKATLTRGRSRG